MKERRGAPVLAALAAIALVSAVFPMPCLAGPGSLLESVMREFELTAVDPMVGSEFGGPVAISADGSTLVVGRPGALAANVLLGTVYIYTRSGSGALQQAEIVASDGMPDDAFGAAVAVSADGNTALIGSPWGNNQISGAAYVLARSGTTWTQVAKLTPADVAPRDFFGTYVALSGDGTTALINGNTAAYVFTLSGGGIWSQQTKLTAPDSLSRVALSADGNVALTGAPTSAPNGAAYVFTRSDSNWSQQAILTGPSTGGNTAQGDFFGDSVALSGDGHTALIGSPLRNSNVGAAYVFTGAGSNWTQQAVLTPSDGVHNDEFGTVTLSADGSTAIVSSPFHDNASGAAYLFVNSGTAWTQLAELTAYDGASGDMFGSAVSVSANGDSALVGGPRHNALAGAAYIVSYGPPIFRQLPSYISILAGITSDGGGLAVSGGHVIRIPPWSPDPIFHALQQELPALSQAISIYEGTTAADRASSPAALQDKIRALNLSLKSLKSMQAALQTELRQASSRAVDKSVASAR